MVWSRSDLERESFLDALCERSMVEGNGNGATMPGKPRRIRFTLNEWDRLMIIRSRTVMFVGGDSTFFSRGDRTPLELFLAGVRGWEAGLRQCLNDGTTSAQ